MGREDFKLNDGADSKFAKQMQAAGVTPLHRIGIAVSGGADSMALCLLAAQWKRSTEKAAGKYGGLFGFVVDHNLRSGSANEAMRVQQWVSNVGLDCDILKCVWVGGIPSLGHLQETARNARYALLAEACQYTGVEVLLTAHHADDQAELFVLRLSRCSGIAGLAGMAFATNLHPAMKSPIPCCLRLVRPLLKFVKEELYAICQKSGQDWVEDPTNLNLSFARNRIRKALQEPSFLVARSEIQELIAFCRKARRILDRDCDHLLLDATQVSQDCGHVTIELEKMVSSGASDAVIHRAVAAIMQFAAQRTKPPRGRAVSSAVDHLRAKFSKGAYTVGGCNVFPAPRSKGSKAIICFSPDSPSPSAQGVVHLDHQRLSKELSATFTRVPASLSQADVLRVEDPILDELQSSFVSDAISVLALDMKTPRTAVNEFQRLGLVSEAGASLLKDLASDVSKDMHKQPVTQCAKWKSTSSKDMETAISCGESRYFMDRFVVSFSATESALVKLNESVLESDAEASLGDCCLLRQNLTLWIRHFEEKDWAYLSHIARQISVLQGTTCDKFKTHLMSNHSQRPHHWSCQKICTAPTNHHALPVTECLRPLTAIVSAHKPHLTSGPFSYVANYTADEFCKVNSCGRQWCNIERYSKAKEALAQLRSIPKLVRRGLPVLVTAQGVLFGMPSVGYRHCPLVSMTAAFCPRAPLHGGQSSWL